MSINFYKIIDNKVVQCANETEWLHWFSANGPIRVAYTQINNDIKVSTLFVGTSISDTPLPFETVVMGADFHLGSKSATWQEAKDNHEVAVLTTRQLLARVDADASLKDWWRVK
jgi:hypothetical protein